MSWGERLFWLTSLTACFIVSLRRCPSVDTGRGNDETVRETVTVTKVDTVKVNVLSARDSIVVRYVKVPVSLDEKRDSVTVRDTVYAELPISQKTYRDSAFTAWVSGYAAQLDSIEVYPRHDMVTIKEKTFPRRRKRWGIGLHAGYGYAVGRGMEPYVGIGLNYNLFGF